MDFRLNVFEEHFGVSKNMLVCLALDYRVSVLCVKRRVWFAFDSRRKQQQGINSMYFLFFFFLKVKNW